MVKESQKWWDFPAVLRMLSILWLAGLTLQVTRWSSDLILVSVISILGCIIGIAMGFSIFRKWSIFWLSLAITLVVVPLFLGFTFSVDGGWVERQYIFLRQLGVTLSEFIRNDPVSDPTLFLSGISLFYWILGISAGYSFVRSLSPWISVILAGIGIFTIAFYAPNTIQIAVFSAFFIFFVLLLMTRVFYLKSRARWLAAGMEMDSDEGFDLNRNIIIGIVIIIILAWTLPLLQIALTPGTLENQALNEYLENFRIRFGNVVAPLNNPNGQPIFGYDENLFFNTETPTRSEIVFYAEPSYSLPAGNRFYWRGWVYDTYNLNQWVDSSAYRRNFLPSEILQENPEWHALQNIEVEFRVQQILVNYYITGNPETLNSGGRVFFPSILGGNEDLAALQPLNPLDPGEVYTLTSNISLPTQAELHSAGTSYPAWVMERYLQIPSQVSQRVNSLAEEIAGNNLTPYDQVVAVTNYLRSNMSYSDSVPVPPPGRDMIEWFLFDFKNGFCTYYASAEVMLLRSLGIPSRLAVGFAQGIPIEEGRIFQVRQRDSHAWPEVFFPGYGWIVFEPTSALPEPVLPLGIETGGEELQEPELVETVDLPQVNMGQYSFGDTPNIEVGLLPELQNENRWLLLGIVTIIIGVSGIIIYCKRYQLRPHIKIIFQKMEEMYGNRIPGWFNDLHRKTCLSDVERSFEVVPWAIAFLGSNSKPSMTAQEKAEQLMELLPTKESKIIFLLEAYHLQVFRSKVANSKTAKEAARQIRVAAILKWLDSTLTPSKKTK